MHRIQKLQNGVKNTIYFLIGFAFGIIMLRPFYFLIDQEFAQDLWTAYIQDLTLEEKNNFHVDAISLYYNQQVPSPPELEMITQIYVILCIVSYFIFSAYWIGKESQKWNKHSRF